MHPTPVAIVGRGCVLPGALDPTTFWQRIAAGEVLISEADDDRWGLRRDLALSADPSDSADRAWSARGGYVRGFEQVFDPRGFGVSPERLEGLDPLFLWPLHAGREALREARVDPARTRVSAVLGNLGFPSASMARFSEEVWQGEGTGTRPENRFMSGLPAHLLAEGLGLSGGAYALDAACASSLYAIKLAMDQLADGEADVVLAGAVNRSDDLFIHVGFCALQALSKSGRSRPFHAGADGLLPAEGCVLFALKRLEDARRDGDRIHGILRSVGLSNDGRRGGILAPDASGQVRSMRAAWDAAGLSPRDVGYVECHATGTPVGDGVELSSMSEVFGHDPELRIGSVKANLGHPITVAGAAGLLRVLGALASGLVPPTPGLDDALEALDYRVPQVAEPWPVGRPRRAAVSAFGFGGNNAHLIVEADEGQAIPAAAPARAPVAVVGLGARVGTLPDAPSFARFLTGADSLVGRAGAPAHEVALPLKGLRFPPKDLQQTLPQQLLVLAAAKEALDAAGEVDPDRTGVLVGMGADPEVCRYGTRWRLAERAADEGWSDAQLVAARDAVVPVLKSAGVVGTMPNIPANRVQSALDLRGPGYTVSSEELSGVDALRIARRALETGELDTIVVGATDLSCEPVHVTAMALLGRQEPPGDAAVALVLERLDVATARGRRILAVLDDTPGATLPSLATRLGHAHAASGLVHVAAATALVATTDTPSITTSTAAAGRAVHTTVRQGAAPAPLPAPADAGPMLTLPAHAPAVVLPPLVRPESDVHRMPSAPWLPPITGDATPEEEPAPVLDGAALLGGGARPRIVRLPEEQAAGQLAAAASSTLQPPPPSFQVAPPAAPTAPSVPVAVTPPRHAPTTPTFAAPPAAVQPGSDLATALLAQQATLAAAHQAFLEQQAAVHTQFLELRKRAADALLRGVGMPLVPGAVAPTPVTHAAPVAHAPAPRALPAPAVRPPAPPTPTVAKPSPVITPPVPTTRAPAPPAPVVAEPEPAPKPAPVAKAAPKPAAKKKNPLAVPHIPERALVPAAQLPGPKLDKDGLAIHASGNISEIFGPMFAQQDGYDVQVRMPEPPLLLADRMVGLDCEPGKLGRGVIWTETDITEDAWWSFQGRMPAGVMIESGQADLMLISYMGIDFLNQGDRAYRLLGCELTYHGGLPTVGETLRYEIHVDGHANQGPVRLFFFHYDCTNQRGEPRLTVRGGQAGFFTTEELDDSAGILWEAETGEHDATARLDPPDVVCTRTRFGPAHIAALAAGDAYGAFGPGWEYAQAHNDTPRIQAAPMCFFQEITEIDTQGGPWKRGYLKARWEVSPDDWFFEGHFKNDPCMPGTLMFEGCLQALAFYLASMGFTIHRDGWRFEPVPDSPIPMRCRGQVLPSAKELTYEVFVEEVHNGPVPMIFADLLCTVDGLKAFHARRCGLQLVPAWPLDYRAEELVPERTENVLVRDGFRFDERSMMACAWGRGSEAFGPMYSRFDGYEPVPRLPGPPYLFMSRAESLTDGELGGMDVGTKVRVAWDIPEDAWYFDDNGTEVMPFCVFLEAALQPCGWLASAVGSALTVEEPLFFRNLDGTGHLTRDIPRTAGTLVTDVTITSISKSAGMIIESFDVTCSLGDEAVYTMKTVFGFFPAEALANQIGLTVGDDDRAALLAPCDRNVDLTVRPARFFGGSLRLPSPMLCMIDRVASWPEGGKHGKGRLRSEKDVDPAEWFFKAHFFQDPVQPGSLGIEAMLQLLQFWMIDNDMGAGMAHPRFEALANDRPMTWKYRGQVVPKNKMIRVEMDIVEFGEDDEGVYAVAESRLWADKLCIYSATNIGMRIVDGAPADALEADLGSDTETVDPETSPWVADHAPTWTVPALPMTDLVDRLARAVARANPGQRVSGLSDVRVHKWVTVDRARTLRTEVDGHHARLLDEDGELLAEGTVALGGLSPVPAIFEAAPVVRAEDPYDSGHLFHGPALQLLTELSIGAGASSGWIDLDRDQWPEGLLRPGLLDAMTHVIPHDRMHLWDDRISETDAAYPLKLDLRLHGELPRSGRVRVEARYVELVAGRLPVTELQLLSDNGVLLVSLRLTEVLVPKGPVGEASPAARVAFLRDREPRGIALATVGAETVLTAETLKTTDWLPGTVASAWGLTGDDALAEVAVRDHVAAQFGVHPSTLTVDGSRVTSTARPLEQVDVVVARDGDTVRVTGAPTADLSTIEAFWSRWFDLGRWPVEDLFYSLTERFVRQVHVDPAFEAVRGKPALFLANHQTGIESLLASVVLGGLIEVPTAVIAKAQHRESWLGKLIAHCFSWPGARDPGVIAFFEREEQSAMVDLLDHLAEGVQAGERSLMVHVEGTRSQVAGDPVRQVSGVFLDLAAKLGIPVVPVRFTGGLPATPADARLEFPVGDGQQDIHVGAPLMPDTLGALPLKARKQAVIDAINALGPAQDAPLPARPDFSARVDAAVAETGALRPYAVMLETLRNAELHSDGAGRLVRGETAGDGAEDVWLQTLSGWLRGA